MSLTVVHDADGKILVAYRPLPDTSRTATPILLEGQHILEFADEPEELASLSILEIGKAHAVDLVSGKLIRK